MHASVIVYLALVGFAILMIFVYFFLPYLDRLIVWLERAGNDQSAN